MHIKGNKNWSQSHHLHIGINIPKYIHAHTHTETCIRTMLLYTILLANFHLPLYQEHFPANQNQTETPSDQYQNVILKKQTTKGYRETKQSYAAGGKVDWQSYYEMSMKVSQRTKMDPDLPLLGLYLKECDQHTQKYLHTHLSLHYSTIYNSEFTISAQMLIDIWTSKEGEIYKHNEFYSSKQE